MKIKARAPARIDLAGGTLDLWPLYLFFENTATINCAIDQFAEVDLDISNSTPRSGSTPIELNSEDRGVKREFSQFGDLLESFSGTHKAVSLDSALWLHARVLRHFYGFWKRPSSLKLSTRCASPAGAGLGGSSALNIALCVALKELTRANYSDDDLLNLARDLETTVIDVPAGVQDYWSALFGGVNAIRLNAGKLHRRSFYKQGEFLEKHLILCYGGQSRNSGINNWAVYKGFIDGDAKIKTSFQEIVKATYRVEEALDRMSFDMLAEGIDQEWCARQLLAPTIATPEMLRAVDLAKEEGAISAKVCGAGGGGCFVIAVPEEKKSKVRNTLLTSGVRVIDFKVVDSGCQAVVS